MSKTWWLLSKQEMENSPSSRDGIDNTRELNYRQQLATLIQDMGQRLKLVQLSINTAIVYMHRFFSIQSLRDRNRNEIALAALFLAAKTEEQPRPVAHVIRVFHAVLHKEATPDKQTLARLDENLQQNERDLLMTIGFDVSVEHPHPHVVRCTQMIKAPKELAQTSYFMATNSLHLTTFCLQYRPPVVACVCIYLAAKWSSYEIPTSSDGLTWFNYVDEQITERELEDLVQEFLKILHRSPSRIKKKLSNHSRGVAGNLEAPPPINLGRSSSSSSVAVSNSSGVAVSNSSGVAVSNSSATVANSSNSGGSSNSTANPSKPHDALKRPHASSSSNHVQCPSAKRPYHTGASGSAVTASSSSHRPSSTASSAQVTPSISTGHTSSSSSSHHHSVGRSSSGSSNTAGAAASSAARSTASSTALFSPATSHSASSSSSGPRVSHSSSSGQHSSHSASSGQHSSHSASSGQQHSSHSSSSHRHQQQQHRQHHHASASGAHMPHSGSSARPSAASSGSSSASASTPQNSMSRTNGGHHHHVQTKPGYSATSRPPSSSASSSSHAQSHGGHRSSPVKPGASNSSVRDRPSQIPPPLPRACPSVKKPSPPLPPPSKASNASTAPPLPPDVPPQPPLPDDSDAPPPPPPSSAANGSLSEPSSIIPSAVLATGSAGSASQAGPPLSTSALMQMNIQSLSAEQLAGFENAVKQQIELTSQEIKTAESAARRPDNGH